MARVLLALGSNLGDRRAILARACAEVAALPGCQLLARSRWQATLPIGGAEGQIAFLNGALLLETNRQPSALASALLEIETRLGRERLVRWDARLIDIDMLLYAAAIINTNDLIVPHPRMAFRLFVLEPAVEVAGAMLHPTSGWTLSGLLAHLRNSPRYLVVTATQQPIADWLVMHLSQTLGCPVLPTPLEKDAGGGVSQPARGVQLPARRCGQAPLVVTMCPDSLDHLAATRQSDLRFVRPALVLALDMADPRAVRAAAAAAGFVVEPSGSESTGPDRPHDPLLNPIGLDPFGLGPLARITGDDPGSVLQEALAAVRCVWPDVECRQATTKARTTQEELES